MSIEVNQLTKVYQSQKAIDQISFQISKGEVVGFLGPNGAGKSTTMKILTSYLLPTSGKASVCGMDVVKKSIDVRKKLGYLPENNPLYFDMYVKEYLTFIAQVHQVEGNISKRVAEMVEMTGLEREQKKKIGQLSKGYKQRVGLAQALLHHPEVLILDEPTSGLDPNQVMDIRNLIKDIGASKTVLFSSHIMQEVEAVCQRVIIINKGQIIADDSTAAIVHQKAKEQQIKVSFKNAVDKALLMNIKGVKKVVVEGDAYILHVSSKLDVREELFKFAVKQDNSILEISRLSQSLENVFQSLTQQ